MKNSIKLGLAALAFSTAACGPTPEERANLERIEHIDRIASAAIYGARNMAREQGGVCEGDTLQVRLWSQPEPVLVTIGTESDASGRALYLYENEEFRDFAVTFPDFILHDSNPVLMKPECL
ncbi:MAG: hypothetical protein GC136_10420 [Alphaproteobacteria bacterium]|nr:hypothetical protein [Alphaproteobacteria bacterium]